MQIAVEGLLDGLDVARVNERPGDVGAADHAPVCVPQDRVFLGGRAELLQQLQRAPSAAKALVPVLREFLFQVDDLVA